MKQYLVQYARGAFQILDGAQLKKELDEYGKSPAKIYRLVPDYPPERVWAVQVDGIWKIEDTTEVKEIES